MTTDWTRTGGNSWRVTFTDLPKPAAIDVWMQDSGMNAYLSAFYMARIRSAATNTYLSALPSPGATNTSTELRAALRRSLEPNTWVRAVLESRSENLVGPEHAPRLKDNLPWGLLK